MRALALAAALLAAGPALAQTPTAEQQDLQADIASQLGNLAIAGATLRAQNRHLQAELDASHLALAKLDGLTKARIDTLEADLAKAKAAARTRKP